MSSGQFLQKPDIKLSVKQTFGFDSEMKVSAFSKKNEYVPSIDPELIFFLKFFLIDYKLK